MELVLIWCPIKPKKYSQPLRTKERRQRHKAIHNYKKQNEIIFSTLKNNIIEKMKTK